MIFAQLDHDERYDAIHDELRDYLSRHFTQLQSGLQSDSWFWIFDGGEKVALDTFSAMTHQVKSARPGPHVQAVLDVLRQRYRLTVYETPVPEGHEDA